MVISVTPRYNPNDSEIPLAATRQELCIYANQLADAIKEAIIANFCLSIAHWKHLLGSLSRCQFFTKPVSI